MQTKAAHIDNDFALRAKLPQYFRYGALGALGIVLLAVVVGFYRERSRSPFKLKSEHAQLSTDVVAEVNGYERLESDAGLSKYYIKADHAKTFSDNHQELENVYLETYDADGVSNNKMTAESALYIPEEAKNFTAYLKGDVNIETREQLKVKTNNVVYTKKTDTADADELVEFERGNIRGHAVGASVKITGRSVDLLKDVEIEAFDSPELSKAGVRYAKINAGSASFDQASNKIDLHENVAINIASTAKGNNPARNTDVRANRASVTLAGSDAKSAALKQFELFDDVHIVSTESGAAPTTIDAGYALYDKDADRYELKNGAHVVASANNQPTDMTASSAVFEQGAHKLALTGDVRITQGASYLSGDSIYADLFADNKIRSGVVRGNASARQSTPERTTNVAAPELNASYNDARQLQDANAIGESTVEIVPNGASGYAQVVAKAVRGIGLAFKGEGLIDKMRTDGRTTIQLNAAGGTADAANKRITADVVTTAFAANGKDISRAEAVGDAELYVEPLQAAADNYRTTIDAPRFNCEFYAGNNVRTCVGGRKTKTVRVPTVPADRRGTQTLFADQVTATFAEASRDVERLDAAGNAKFTELDRTTVASEMTYTSSDATVRLRGGEPTTWDSTSRARAREIDWDTKNAKSYMRGGVSTTYYNRKQMGDAAPFASSDKPVFVTATSAEFDHNAQTGLYVGNARGWQENNFVRADKLLIRQREGQLSAEGAVQSGLYNAKIKRNAREASVPVFAQAASLSYERDARVLRYRGNVDIRQGTDRMTSGSADVYLDEKNEVSRTVAETSVVMTQPGRRAVGDWAQYTADNELAVLRGSPATVTDSENGSSQGGELTFNMRDHRVTGQGTTKQNPTARTRSVYRVKTSQ